MIEAKELRIGNFINLTKDDFKSVKVWELDAFDIYESSETNCVDIQPIPLTEEWLVKLGGKVLEDDCYYFELTNDEILAVESSDFSYGIYESIDDSNSGKGYSTYRLLESVHQLQNLYFELTGKELETK